MGYSINFNEEKNQLLKESRKVCFDDVIDAVERGKLVGNIKHFNQRLYPSQFLFLVDIDTYIYVVPYVVDKKNETLHLKTVYPSRKYTKLYEEAKNEKNKK